MLKILSFVEKDVIWFYIFVMYSTETQSNILKFFISSENEILVILDDLKIKAKLSKVDDVYFYLKMSIDIELQKLPYGISCLIPYGKDLFFFNSEIVKFENGEACCILPANIIKKHHREYERYNVEGILFASLNIIKEIDDKEFINRFPKSVRSIFKEGLQNVSYEKVVDEIIANLNNEFKEVLFIDGFSQLPWLKYCRNDKIGLVAQSIDPKYLLDPVKVYGFATYGYFLEPSKRNIFDNEVKMFINYHTSKGFKSYVYAPIFVVDTLLGYLMICHDEEIILKDYKNLLKLMKILGMIDLIEQFFCYNRFFVLNEHRDYPIPIIDIGFGGIKIKIDKHIAYFINVGDMLKVYFRIGSKFFEILGEVIRVSYENNNLVSAIRFVNMDKDTFLHIRKWFSSFKRW